MTLFILGLCNTFVLECPSGMGILRVHRQFLILLRLSEEGGLVIYLVIRLTGSMAILNQKNQTLDMLQRVESIINQI